MRANNSKQSDIDEDDLLKKGKRWFQWAKEPQDGAAPEAQNSVHDKEPVVSKPYVMPDDPEERLRRSAHQGCCRGQGPDAAHACGDGESAQAHREEVTDARTYGITAFARDVLDIADNCSARWMLFQRKRAAPMPVSRG
jgi:hypothetical protein